MGIITITRQYGSKGSEIGEHIADALGYRLLDKNIVSKLAQKAQITETEASIYEENGATTFGYFFQKYFCAPHLLATSANTIDDIHWAPPQGVYNGYGTLEFDEDLCAKHTQDLILQEAEQDNVVIVGRGAATLLAHYPNTLQICVFAPKVYRQRTLMMRYGISANEALAKLQTVDNQRQRFAKRHYQANDTDSSNYHVLINSGKTDIHTAIHMVLETEKRKQVHKTWTHAMEQSS
jgi:CMP/dCMP kinase